MVLPASLTLQGFAYALDGGTTVIHATDETGRECSVMLVQHAFPQGSPSFDVIPGRLYFDGELVPMRSEVEAGVLSLLKDADVRYKEPANEPRERFQLSQNALILGDDIREVLTNPPEDNIRSLAERVIQFVESDDYLRFPNRVEQAADPTLYDLWVEWDEVTRNRVLVKLASVLGVGLAGAQEFLSENRPLEARVTALRVPELVTRYHAEGLRLRAVPAFRWRLPTVTQVGERT